MSENLVYKKRFIYYNEKDERQVFCRLSSFLTY